MGPWNWPFRRKRMMEALDQDIRDFIERETQDNIERGMSPEEARYAALRKFGNVTRVREDTREVWTMVWLEQLWQDIRFGLRQLRTNPTSSLAVMLTLALGIGAISALFSFVYAAVLRPLPFADPGQLVWVSSANVAKAGETRGFSGIELREWRPRFEGIFNQFATFSGDAEGTWRKGEQGMHLVTRTVSGNFFSLLGAHPWAGRLLAPDDAQAGHGSVVVLGYDFWQRQFGGDPGILGQQMSERGGDYPAYTIVGILPPQFVWEGVTDVWMPQQPQTSYLANMREHRPFQIVGRLQPGVGLAGAQAAMETLTRQEVPSRSAGNNRWQIRLEFVRDHLRAGGQRGLFLLWAAAGCLLLIACVNVAHVLLARANARQTEMAMRLALGASRKRLFAQLLTEGGLLALGGAIAGWMWASTLVGLLARRGSLFLPPVLLRSVVGLHAAPMQPAVLIFTTLAAVLSVLMFGLIPALRGSRAAPNPAEHKRRLGGALVVAEVAMTTILVVCAGLLIRSFTQLMAVKPGFASANRLTFSLELPRSPMNAMLKGGVRLEYQRKAAWFVELENRLHALPGVLAVGAADDLPILDEAGGWGGYQVNGQNLPDDTTLALASPGYFAAMGAPMLAGSGFDAARDAAQTGKSIILNRTMADLLYPHQNPVGLRITAPRCGMNLSSATSSSDCVIVGVVGDMRYRLGATAPPTFYYSIDQDAPDHLNFVILADSDPRALIPMTRTTVRNMPTPDFGQPYLFNLQTLTDVVADSLAAPRFQSWLVGLFAGLALLLAAVGIYGVESYAVSRRTHEFGVRIAVGAHPAQVYGLVASGAAGKTLLGIAIGLAAGQAAGHLVAHLLYGVRVWDPLTLLAAPAVLLVVALAASALPACRAAMVDPIVALRYE